jgi:hypothetical protein
MSTARSFTAVAALGGVLQFALGLTAYQIVAATVLPDLAQPARVQAAHLAAHRPGTLFWAMVALETAGLLLFLAFAAYLADRLCKAGAPAWLGATARAVAVTAVAVKLASFPPALTAVQHPHTYGDATTAALLQVNGYGDQVMLALQGACFLLFAAAAVAARCHRFLPGVAFVGGVATVAAAFGWDSGQLGGIAVVVAAAAWLIRTRPLGVPVTRSAAPVPSGSARPVESGGA